MQNQEKSEKQACIQVRALVRKGNFYKRHIWLSNSGNYIQDRQSTCIMYEPGHPILHLPEMSPCQPLSEYVGRGRKNNCRMRVAGISVPPFPTLGERFCSRTLQTPLMSVLPRRCFLNLKKQERWPGSSGRINKRSPTPSASKS